MEKNFLLLTAMLAIVTFVVPRVHGQDPVLMQKLTAVVQKMQACGSDQHCLAAATKEMQDIQQQLANTLPGSQGASGLHMTEEEWLQRQCTETDKHPKFSCLPVRIQLTDSTLEEHYESVYTGLLPGPGTKYTSLHMAFTYTAEGKGKLLYEKDFASFQLLAAATAAMTRIHNLESWEQTQVGHHGDQPVLRRTVHPSAPLKINRPSKIYIYYPFEAQYPHESATHNLFVVSTFVFFGPSLDDRTDGTNLPDEHAHEPMISPAVMKQFVTAGGFERTFQWEETEPGAELRQHKLSFKVEFQAQPGKMAVTPMEGFQSTGPETGKYIPLSKTYTVKNIGGSPIQFDVSKTQKWLDISTASGTLEPGTSTSVTVSIKRQAVKNQNGTYTDSVRFFNSTNGQGDTVRPIELAVDWCKEAKRMGLDITKRGRSAAGVICINGEAIPCVWQNSRIPEIDECALEHERSHAKKVEIECPHISSFETSVFPTRPIVADDECAAYKRQLSCLQQKRSICSKIGSLKASYAPSPTANYQSVTTKECEKDFDFATGNVKDRMREERCH